MSHAIIGAGLIIAIAIHVAGYWISAAIDRLADALSKRDDGA